MKDWKDLARELYFARQMKIGDIGKELSVSRKSISTFLHSLEEFAGEKEKRKQESKAKRKEYQRQWDREHRGKNENPFGEVNAESIRREHDIAAMILSRERFYR